MNCGILYISVSLSTTDNGLGVWSGTSILVLVLLVLGFVLGIRYWGWFRGLLPEQRLCRQGEVKNTINLHSVHQLSSVRRYQVERGRGKGRTDET
jgi:Tfp pilus assembly protein PilO